MLKNQLTAEESAKLIELGVSPERASEIKVEVKEPSRGCPNIYCSEVKHPIFTLADILDILPKIVPDAGGDLSYALKIQPCSRPGWQVCYYAYSLDNGKGYQSSPELIDALYSLLLWCLEKGYVKFDKIRRKRK